MFANRRKQGDIGVAEAFSYYAKKGYIVSFPVTEASRYDLIVDDGKSLLKVQCKTSTYTENNGNSYTVSLVTSGGNRSGSSKRSKISKDECDIVFVWCANETIWEIPSEDIEGKSTFTASKINEKYLVGGNLNTQEITNIRKNRSYTTKIDWPDYETLCDMVNQSSMVKVASELGVSDKSVAKRVKRGYC